MALLGRVIGGDPALRVERNLLFWGFGLCFVPMVCMFLVLRFALTPVST